MRKLLSLLLVIVLISCEDDSQAPVDLGPTIEAEAQLFSISQLNDTQFEILDISNGVASFSQTGNVVTLTISLSGFEPNSNHAVHIHNGTVEEPGRHWNQRSAFAFCNEISLGQVWAKPFAGDVGNVSIGADGNGTYTMQTDLWRLNSGDDLDILDKVVIIHDQPENFAEECDPNHSHDHLHVNKKIAGGTIILTSDIEQKVQGAMTHFPDFTICK